MIDVFHAIHACADLVHYWDVARRGEGVILHATSSASFSTRKEAEEVAGEIAARVQPDGYDVDEVDVRAKIDDSGTSWHAVVELLLS
jgi:hypothetical protein